MMPHIILTDHVERDHLLPLTHTRPVSEIRIGLWTIMEKWRFELPHFTVSALPPGFLSKVFATQLGTENIFINGALLPTKDLVEEISSLKIGTCLYFGDTWVASRTRDKKPDFESNKQILKSTATLVDRPWKIFQLNGVEIKADLDRLRNSRSGVEVPTYVTMIGDDIFLEEGAKLMPCTINTDAGPVYIGKGAEVMEGSLIRGPFALMEHSQLKMGAKIYGATTIGPHSKVGGEVNNCVIFGFSNKAHDGFIGNSVIGEWCNLGADTNTSNLKNNYADVKIHNYALGRSESTHSQFCGLIMGDHAKAGINTMFNTGTVCGVFTNVFGGDFPHRRIPDFGWGGAQGFKSYRLADALEVAERVMSRRGVTLTKDWVEVFSTLHEQFSPK